MIDKQDTSALMKAIAAVLKDIKAEIQAEFIRIWDRVDNIQYEKGEKGDRGDIGPAGKDAEPVNIAEIVSQVLSKIPTPKDGANGKDAEPVNIAEIVSQVLSKIPTPKDGTNGVAGVPGRDGVNGINGIDGRDALQVDILPSIDLSRTYPRGTFARFQNGLIRAYRDTIPAETIDKAGWEVVVAGINQVWMTMKDEGRKVVVNLQLTGGPQEYVEFDIPTMVYRGVWKAGTYREGDVVTYGGSAWYCRKETANAPRDVEGDEVDWKLMVKEGRRGKEGQKGDKGDAGKDGRDRWVKSMDFDGNKHE